MRASREVNEMLLLDSRSCECFLFDGSCGTNGGRGPCLNGSSVSHEVGLEGDSETLENEARLEEDPWVENEFRLEEDPWVENEPRLEKDPWVQNEARLEVEPWAGSSAFSALISDHMSGAASKSVSPKKVLRHSVMLLSSVALMLCIAS